MDALSDDLARDPLAFALALPALPHVGRVTTARILERFPTLDALRATPHEQLLHRLAGTPHLTDLVGTLHDDAAMAFALASARAEADALAAKRLALLAPNLDGWPDGLNRLDRAERPALLHVFGDASALHGPSIALFGANGLDPAAYEASQTLAAESARRGVTVVTGLADGFDVATAKTATRHGGRVVAVLGCGIGRLAGPMRPVAIEIARNGGAMVSGFGFDHGPFDHDDKERALAMAAMATACAFFDPAPGSPDARALDRAAALGLVAQTTGPRAPADAPRLSGNAADDLDRLLA